ncbi:MAG: hypothetical protein J7555_11420, partial [Chloroflexi bacterium]|nr:hypothetical protein [Chloroflexota bacterium]
STIVAIIYPQFYQQVNNHGEVYREVRKPSEFLGIQLYPAWLRFPIRAFGARGKSKLNRQFTGKAVFSDLSQLFDPRLSL